MYLKTRNSLYHDKVCDSLAHVLEFFELGKSRCHVQYDGEARGQSAGCVELTGNIFDQSDQLLQTLVVVRVPLPGDDVPQNVDAGRSQDAAQLDGVWEIGARLPSHFLHQALGLFLDDALHAHFAKTQVFQVSQREAPLLLPVVAMIEDQTFNRSELV